MAEWKPACSAQLLLQGSGSVRCQLSFQELAWRGVCEGLLRTLRSMCVYTDKDYGDHLALAQIHRAAANGRVWCGQQLGVPGQFSQHWLGQSHIHGEQAPVCLPLLWCDPGGFSVLLFSSLEETGVLEVLRRECCQSELGKWVGSAQYLCSIILLRELPKCYKYFYSWPCCKFKSIGPCSLGIWSFQMKLYLPLVIINLQFSPWLIFRNVHNEKL